MRKTLGEGVVSTPTLLVSEGLLNDTGKDGGPGEARLLCSFYHESLRTEIKTNVHKFAISNHTGLKLAILVLKSYFEAITRI